MTARIGLTPAAAASLAAEAEARGLTLETCVQGLLEDRPAMQARKVSLEEMETALDRLAEMGRGLPHLSDYASTGESICEGATDPSARARGHQHPLAVRGTPQVAA